MRSKTGQEGSCELKQAGGWICEHDDIWLEWINDSPRYLDMAVARTRREAICGDGCKPIKVMVKVERVGG